MKKIVKDKNRPKEWSQTNVAEGDSKVSKIYQEWCPRCGSHNVYRHDSDMGDEDGSIEYRCEHCNSEWEIYVKVTPLEMQVTENNFDGDVD